MRRQSDEPAPRLRVHLPPLQVGLLVKALSIRQPWAWYILYAGKDVENRGTRWNYRGPVLLHVGASLTKDEYLAWRAAGESMRSDPEPRAKLPEYS